MPDIDRPLDLRIERTYKMLCDAFTRLLTSQRYEDITVSDLCDAAMIRRTTFYKHFASKAEFFAFYVKNLRDEFQRASAPEEGGEDARQSTMRMTRELISFLQTNVNLVDGVIRSDMLGTLLDILSEQIERDIFMHMCDENGTDGADASLEYRAAFYAGGLVRAIRRWWMQRDDDPRGEAVLSSIAAALA